ncbi:MAG: PIN domain-containing protein, partial [Planctomycetota bacterium]|nr:PIN domain-containing protein [Planctomycetota bacterium]
MGNAAVSLADAWALYDRLCIDPRVGFVNELSNVELLWRTYTNRKTVSPKLWTDAFLAAIAQAYGLEMVTFDKAFHQFADLKFVILP